MPPEPESARTWPAGLACWLATLLPRHWVPCSLFQRPVRFPSAQGRVTLGWGGVAVATTLPGVGVCSPQAIRSVRMIKVVHRGDFSIRGSFTSNRVERADVLTGSQWASALVLNRMRSL